MSRTNWNLEQDYVGWIQKLRAKRSLLTNMFTVKPTCSVNELDRLLLGAMGRGEAWLTPLWPICSWYVDTGKGLWGWWCCPIGDFLALLLLTLPMLLWPCVTTPLCSSLLADSCNVGGMNEAKELGCLGDSCCAVSLDELISSERINDIATEWGCKSNACTMFSLTFCHCQWGSSHDLLTKYIRSDGLKTII